MVAAAAQRTQSLSQDSGSVGGFFYAGKYPRMTVSIDKNPGSCYNEKKQMRSPADRFCVWPEGQLIRSRLHP